MTILGKFDTVDAPIEQLHRSITHEESVASRVFPVVDWPTHGISRAMLGPVYDAPYSWSRSTYVVWCVAVSADGAHVEVFDLHPRALLDMPSTWRRLDKVLQRRRIAYANGTNKELDQARDTFLWPEFAKSCFASLNAGDPIHPAIRKVAKELEVSEYETTHPQDHSCRLEIETRAKALLKSALLKAIQKTLKVFDSGLLQVIQDRPHLSLSKALILLHSADAHCSRARQFVMQALRTEPVGFIHLMAENEVKNGGNQLRQALFEGRSVPAALKFLGITPATRRLLLKFDNQKVDGGMWLEIAHIYQEAKIQQEAHSREFFRIVQMTTALASSQSGIVCQVLRWCACKGGKSIPQRAAHFSEEFHRLHQIFSPIDGRHNIDEQIANALTTADKDGGILFSCHEDWSFRQYPGVPVGLALPPSWKIRSLNSVQLALAHGDLAGNCLSQATTLLEYVKRGDVLFGLYVEGTATATIALRPVIFDGDVAITRTEAHCFDATFEAKFQLQDFGTRIGNLRTVPLPKDPYERGKLILREMKFAKNTVLKKLVNHLIHACSTPTELPLWKARAVYCST